MKKAAGFGKLVKDLSRDPRLKKAVAKAARHPRSKGVRKAEDAAGLFVLLTKIASPFLKRKKARALQDAMEMIYLLVQVSVLVKENIFDRPEVKIFFSESLRQIYSTAEEFVAMVLPKAKAVGAQVRPQAKPRGAALSLRSP